MSVQSKQGRVDLTPVSSPVWGWSPTGQRIAIPRLREAKLAEPSIRDHFLLYVQAFAVQGSQTAISNARHTIEERLARWLLMSHERV